MYGERLGRAGFDVAGEERSDETRTGVSGTGEKWQARRD